MQHGAAAAGELITLKQGRFLGRPSRIMVQRDASGDIMVSGGVVVLARGQLL